MRQQLLFGYGVSRDIFAAYRRIYEKFFELTHAGVDEIKFMEKNLSVNFSRAYEIFSAIHREDSFSFFEVAFGDKKHLDCVILNDTTGELFAIEAKRFGYQFHEKSQEIGKDINRIAEFVNEEPWKNFPFRYGVILADIWDIPRDYANWWDQNLESAEIISSYYDATFLNKFKIGGELSNVQYDIQADISRRGYYLLSFWWEIS